MGFKDKGLLVGAGFLLGTVGVKAATSPTARRLYVKAVSKGLQAKAGCEDIVEEAKSNLDDIVAEANYINEQEAEGTAVEEAAVSVSATRKTTGKKAAATTKK